MDEFQECLLALITALHDVTDGQIVAIDGKTLRRSFDRASSKTAIHMVSAWASANHISLGQVVVDEKSNEITAIPKLLKMLELSGCLVTIDAMGCQVEIAQAIVDAKADYVLAVKKNRAPLRRVSTPTLRSMHRMISSVSTCGVIARTKKDMVVRSIENMSCVEFRKNFLALRDGRNWLPSAWCSPVSCVTESNTWNADTTS